MNHNERIFIAGATGMVGSAIKKLLIKKGYGNKILKRILEELKDTNYDIYLHAQVQVVDFYNKQGFIKKGDIFSEAGIQHYKKIYN